MYAGVGQAVEWKNKQYRVIGMAPAGRVNCGNGMAALLIVEGRSVYINTKDLRAV